MVEEQISLLHSSGLYDHSQAIYIGVNGDQVISSLGDKFHVSYHDQPWTEETQTIRLLRSFCQSNPSWAVLYLHTKGITQPSRETHDWRKAMEYFCIERWDECVRLLDTNDTVGCLYMDDCYYGFFPHYSGNFWWATSEYINTLDESFLTTGIRQNREFWIGTGNGRMYSFINTGLNHYAVRFPREVYAN